LHFKDKVEQQCCKLFDCVFFIDVSKRLLLFVVISCSPT